LGEVLPLYSVLPFLGLLLSIALCPLFLTKFWHDHFGKVAAFWAALIAVPLIIAYQGLAVHQFTQVLVVDYIPFIILLWSLYTISGGIVIHGNLIGTPLTNTMILLSGTVLASWIGTTGASLLLIRFFLRANKHRQNRGFMVVFFIFLVANIGGGLTPLGDPPLFLGFLHGVPFTWTFRLFPQILFLVIILLTIYFCLDHYFYRKESHQFTKKKSASRRLGVKGSYNLIFLAGVIGSVILSGCLDLGAAHFWGVSCRIIDWTRDGLLILMGLFSLLTTPRIFREENEFTWAPILEVGYIFFGLFITMAPCLLILKAGDKGALAFVTSSLKTPAHYFWASGTLSSFLDNAPTYLSFLSSALGSFYPAMPESLSVPRLISENAIFLKAISCGAVFMGANTYIGNAPNFMVRSIAEEAGVPMPNFISYILKYSLPILCPLFLIMTFIFFRRIP
jgi:Na+/H+ antiporter NhaD/arsenite permease-like protein